MRPILAAAALTLVACGAPPFRIEVRTISPVVVGHEDEVRATAEEAARWWGGDSGDLDGWVMVLTDEPLDGVCERVACAKMRERRIYIDCRVLGDDDTGRATLRFLIRHEVGHAVLPYDPDGQHRSPRWGEL